MASNLEFILKLTDMLSPGMRAAASISNTSAGQIETQFAKINAGGKKISASVNELKNRLEAVNKVRFSTTLKNEFDTATRAAQRLESQIEKLQNKGGGKVGGGGMLKSIVGGNLISGAITNVAGGAMDFVKGSVGSAMDFGATKKSFEVLTGSANKGNALSGDLNKLQQDTILGPEVFKHAQTMLGFGVATEKVIPYMKMLGDVSMGNKENLQGLTLAFSQVQAAGKLTGQDLLQFINAGFNPLNEISKQTGISIGDLKKKMEDGAISSDMVAKAFASATGEGGTFNNMLNKLAETPAGKMAQFEGKLETFKVKLGETLMPLAEGAMSFGGKLLDIATNVIPFITEGFNQLSSIFTGINIGSETWGAWLSLIRDYSLIIWNGIKSIGASIWNLLKPIFEWVAKSQMIQDIFWAIGKLGEGVFWVISKVGDALGWVWKNIIQPVLDAIEWVYNKVKSLLGFGSDNTIKVEGSVKTPTSIAPAMTPGVNAAKIIPMNLPSQKANANTAFDGLGGSTGKERAANINAGGQKSIVIHIGKQIEKLEQNIYGNSTEAADNIEAAVREAMKKVINNINAVA